MRSHHGWVFIRVLEFGEGCRGVQVMVCSWPYMGIAEMDGLQGCMTFTTFRTDNNTSGFRSIYCFCPMYFWDNTPIVRGLAVNLMRYVAERVVIHPMGLCGGGWEVNATSIMRRQKTQLKFCEF
jgi:hypothetical protein